MFAAEFQRRKAVVLPYFVQVRLGCDHHTRDFAVHEVLLPNTSRFNQFDYEEMQQFAPKFGPLKQTL